MLAAALGLCASLSWGAADFLGGLKSRKLALLVVLLASQAAGLALAAAVVALRGEGPPGDGWVAPAMLSALAGTAALAAFYRGLAVGAMGVVAPVSATAAVIPVVVGIATGDRPTAVQGAGIVVAIAGVALASREPAAPRTERAVADVGSGERAGVASGVGLALLAALGFGLFFVLMDRASDGDVFWALLVNRVTGVALLGCAVVALRPSFAADRGDLGVLVAIGAADIGANAMFAVAATMGLVSVVGTLASLYPVVTVALARMVLHERVHGAQRAGAAGALAGAAMLAAG